MIAAAIFLCVGTGWAESGDSASDEKAKTKIKALIVAFDDAISSNDVESSLAPYAEDAETFGLIVYKFSNMDDRRKAALRAAAESNVKVTRTMEPKITVVGNWAWAYWTWTSESTDKSGAHRGTLDGRTTFIMEKRDGKWKVIHSHISAPLHPGGRPQ
jgi:ketosteroid isomerase-like protein